MEDNNIAFEPSFEKPCSVRSSDRLNFPDWRGDNPSAKAEAVRFLPRTIVFLGKLRRKTPLATIFQQGIIVLTCDSCCKEKGNVGAIGQEIHVGRMLESVYSP
jgi:hypothetical protein